QSDCPGDVAAPRGISSVRNEDTPIPDTPHARRGGFGQGRDTRPGGPERPVKARQGFRGRGERREAAAPFGNWVAAGAPAFRRAASAGAQFEPETLGASA